LCCSGRGKLCNEKSTFSLLSACSCMEMGSWFKPF
jgi:hypothetical protein